MIQHMHMPWLLLVLLSWFTASAHQAQATEKQPQESWEQTCAQLNSLPFPAEDRPGPDLAKNLDKCSSYELYYGFDGPANPQKARQCAYIEMDKGKDDSPFDGGAMLMTIYANGVGARRNFDLAIKLACKIGGAPAEIEGRIKHLEDLKKQNWQGSNFSLCDDITSGYMAGFCADHRNRFAAIRSAQKNDGLQAKWSIAHKQALASLKKTADQYFEIHAKNEVDQSGTARAALSIEDTAAQEENFTKTLRFLEQGKFPKYSGQQLIDADARLNTAYRKILQTFAPRGGTVTKEGIKSTQRMWLKYRDAWVKFCEIKYPDCSSVSINTYWTLQRSKELEEYLE